MKKLLITLMLTIFCSAGLFAQAQKSDREKHEKMRREIADFKIKYISQEIDLNDSQKKEFYDLYSAMEEEKADAFHEAFILQKKVKHDKDASEEDYARATKALTEAKAKEAEIEQRYSEQFEKVLTPKQMYKMRQAEESFKKKAREMHRQAHEKKKDMKAKKR